MLILFDHGTPAPLIAFLEGHTVTKAKDAGWDKLVNGELLKAAEQAGFDLLLTTDKNMASQQKFEGPGNCGGGTREFAMAGRAALRSQDSRWRERRDTWQLCRGRYSFQVKAR